MDTTLIQSVLHHAQERKWDIRSFPRTSLKSLVVQPRSIIQGIDTLRERSHAAFDGSLQMASLTETVSDLKRREKRTKAKQIAAQ